MNLKELNKINQRYLNAHYCIDPDEVEKVNKLIHLIEVTRDSNTPKTGDIIKFTSEHGDYYDKAIISSVYSDGDIEICERPYTPFVCNYYDKAQNIGMSVSGGSFHNFNKTMFKYIGKDRRKFCVWGNCGACVDGAIDFIATVNVWEVKQKNRFEPYTTKDYNKMYIYKNVKNHKPYTILGDGIAFENEQDYQAFLRTYRAKEFKGYSFNQTVIFYYKEDNYYLTKEEWEKLTNCQIDTRRCNGSIIKVKVKYDDKNKKINVYRYSNYFEPQEEISSKPYLLNYDK